MADYLVNTEEMTETLPSRRERHHSTRKKRKGEPIQPIRVQAAQEPQVPQVPQEPQEPQEPVGEQEKEGPVRSKIFKRERERQKALIFPTFIFWLFILLCGSLLFFSIRHYS
jgi:hypothetical protein